MTFMDMPSSKGSKNEASYILADPMSKVACLSA
jgi:hypothetical protein